jgi:hypothetical protein
MKGDARTARSQVILEPGCDRGVATGRSQVTRRDSVHHSLQAAHEATKPKEGWGMGGGRGGGKWGRVTGATELLVHRKLSAGQLPRADPSLAPVPVAHGHEGQGKHRGGRGIGERYSDGDIGTVVQGEGDV